MVAADVGEPQAPSQGRGAIKKFRTNLNHHKRLISSRFFITNIKNINTAIIKHKESLNSNKSSIKANFRKTFTLNQRKHFLTLQIQKHPTIQNRIPTKRNRQD